MAKVLLLTLILGLGTGCAHKHVQSQVWRFDKCASNNGHIVCECTRWHKEINARNQQEVIVCE
jgi:hypothetical protein